MLQGQPLYAVLTQPPQLLPFTYPPAAALFAVPLALLPWSAAQLAWVPVIYVPLAVVIWFAFAPLLRRVPSGRLRAAAFAVIFAACAYLFPLRDEMRFGQVDMILLALAVADCAARAPRWPRGVLVGLATAIKLVPGVFIVYLWLSGRRRAAVTAAAVALAATLGAWLLLPSDSVTYWTSVIFESGRLGSNAGTSNQSLRGILLRVFLPGQGPGGAVGRSGRRGRGGRLCGGPAAGTGVQGDGGNRGHCAARGAPFARLLDPSLPRRGGGHRRDPGGRALAAAGRHRRGDRGVLRPDHPWWGRSLLGQPDVPVVVAWVVEDAFGIAAVALVVIIARLPPAGRRASVP